MSQKIKNKQFEVISDFDFNINRLINLANPIDSTDAVTKEYVDDNAINYSIGTGLFSGCNVTIDDDTHFSVSSGICYFVDPVTKQSGRLIFTGETYIPLITIGPTDITISIGILPNGTVFQQIPVFSSYQRRIIICLGELMVDPFTQLLSRVRFRPVFSWDASTYVDSAMNEGINNIAGNTISVSGSSLMMNVSSGKMYGYSINAVRSYYDPNTSSFLSENVFNFITCFHNGTEWVYQSSGNTIIPGLYSNGTSSLQTVPNNKWSVRLIMRGALNGNMWISYPTQSNYYNDSNTAIADLENLFVTVPDELFGNVLPCAFLIVRGTATNLSNITDGVLVPVKSMTITAGGSMAVLATDVVFDNSTTTNLTSINTQDALVEINDKIENLNYSSNNKDMSANSGVSGNYLATNITIIDIPRTMVRVEVNSIEIIVGNGVKTNWCYFSGDNGITARTYTNVTQGDSLYWCGDVAPYQLESNDTITFIYMIY
jgi:hypothetical protein